MNHAITHTLDLLWEMTLRELRVRYKNTTLGFLWGGIYPIIQTLIIGFVFRYFYHVSDMNYVYVLFVNILIWNFFSNSLENATASVVQNRSIIKKAKFPYMVVPLSIVLCNAIHMLFSLILFMLFTWFFRLFGEVNIMALFCGSFLLLIFTSGLSLITSALNVKHRDVHFLISAAMMIGFYATPIIYSVALIPMSLRYLWSFNPLTEIVMLFQYSIFGTPIAFQYVIANSTIIVGVVMLGMWMFHYYENRFNDYL